MGYLWYEYIYKLDKVTYNKLHPYTSWIPITWVSSCHSFTLSSIYKSLHLFSIMLLYLFASFRVYICLRNFTQQFRNYSLTLLAYVQLISYLDKRRIKSLCTYDTSIASFLIAFLVFIGGLARLHWRHIFPSSTSG